MTAAVVRKSMSIGEDCTTLACLASYGPCAAANTMTWKERPSVSCAATTSSNDAQFAIGSRELGPALRRFYCVVRLRVLRSAQYSAPAKAPKPAAASITTTIASVGIAISHCIQLMLREWQDTAFDLDQNRPRQWQGLSAGGSPAPNIGRSFKYRREARREPHKAQ
jgi:hypothetical protein